MIKRILMMLGVGMVLAASSLPAQIPMQRPGQPSNAQQQTQAALAAMQPWLRKLDNGDYASAWKEGSRTFQLKSNCDTWVAAMRSVRSPYGPAVRRSIINSVGQPIAPAAGGVVQDSGYFVIGQFDSYFPNKKHAVENVVFEQRVDGKWLVAGYSLTPKS